MKLSDRDRKMAHEYLIDLNAYASAVRAGYATSTARNAAAWINPETPQKPALRKYIDALMAQQSRRTGISADRVLMELARIGFANAGDIIDFETGKVLPTASREDKAAISSVNVKNGKITEYEVKMCDKTQALKLLGMHCGLFAESIKLDGPVPVIIDDSAEEPKPIQEKKDDHE